MTDEIVKNRYRIKSVLGAGSFGETFLAEDLDLPSRRPCVLKRMKPIQDPAKSEEVRQRFEKEAAILEAIGRESNGRIPELYAYFPENGYYYLVQEWIDGPTLGQRLKGTGRFEEGAVRKLVIELLEILEYVHGRRIIHRDIKLENVLLRSDGRPVLIDFGVMKQVVNLDAHGNPTSSVMAGTPAFMSFEQAAGKPVYASDIYSLGVTAICLLAGLNKPDDLTDPLSGDLAWRETAPGVSEEFAVVLTKATEVHFRDRYRTAAEMKAALNGLAPQAPLPSNQPDIVPPPVSQTASTVEGTESMVSPPSPVIRIETPRAGMPFRSGVGMEFVHVPGGRFEMGSTKDDEDRWNAALAKYPLKVDFSAERPRRWVTLGRPFFLGKNPVTIGEYLHYCRETNGHWPAWLEAGSQYHIRTGSNDDYKSMVSEEKTDRRPVVGVSWEDARGYCEWLGRLEGRECRLPTEAEWEYACRAGTTGDFAGDLDEMGWHGNNSGNALIDSYEVWKKSGADWTTYWNKYLKPNGNGTHPVGEKKGNPWGLHDMHGNVWEWCGDWYDERYYQTGPAEDPKGPATGESRVVRGGSWSYNPYGCRSACRNGCQPFFRDFGLGFRVLISAGTP